VSGARLAKESDFCQIHVAGSNMSTAVHHPYIVKAKSVCGGEPVVKGTRIPVRIIVECWRSGQSPEEIRDAYPHLELAHIFDALSYAEDHAAEIAVQIERHREAHDVRLVAETKSAYRTKR
jgi:uncharacterized protein (DUF433 family)